MPQAGDTVSARVQSPVRRTSMAKNRNDTRASVRMREGRGGMSMTDVLVDHLIGQSVTNRGNHAGITIGSQVLPAPTGTIVPIAPVPRERSTSTAALTVPVRHIKRNIRAGWTVDCSLEEGSQGKIRPALIGKIRGDLSAGNGAGLPLGKGLPTQSNREKIDK